MSLAARVAAGKASIQQEDMPPNAQKWVAVCLLAACNYGFQPFESVLDDILALQGFRTEELWAHCCPMSGRHTHTREVYNCFIVSFNEVTSSFPGKLNPF